MLCATGSSTTAPSNSRITKAESLVQVNRAIVTKERVTKTSLVQLNRSLRKENKDVRVTDSTSLVQLNRAIEEKE